MGAIGARCPRRRRPALPPGVRAPARVDVRGNDSPHDAKIRGRLMESISETLAGIAASAIFLVLGRLLLSASSTHRSTVAFQFRLFATALMLRLCCSIVVYQLGF